LVLVERAHTPLDRVAAIPIEERAHTPPDRVAALPVEETSLRVNLRISPDETYLSTVSAYVCRLCSRELNSKLIVYLALHRCNYKTSSNVSVRK
jgi:hypothetical protein